MKPADRRVTRTRKAIYQAFLDLLNSQGYEALTVLAIIEKADVGRSTFYAHYESKESLLEQLCQELFHHLFKRQSSWTTNAYLGHIFKHFYHNQDHITSLLLSKNDYFLRQLQIEVEKHLYPMIATEYLNKQTNVPASYRKYYVSSLFIASITWWMSQRKKVQPEELVEYFLTMLNPL